MMEEDDDVRPANLFARGGGVGDGDGGRGGVGITIRHVADAVETRRSHVSEWLPCLDCICSADQLLMSCLEDRKRVAPGKKRYNKQ